MIVVTSLLLFMKVKSVVFMHLIIQNKDKEKGMKTIITRDSFATFRFNLKITQE